MRDAFTGKPEVPARADRQDELADRRPADGDHASRAEGEAVVREMRTRVPSVRAGASPREKKRARSTGGRIGRVSRAAPRAACTARATAARMPRAASHSSAIGRAGIPRRSCRTARRACAHISYALSENATRARRRIADDGGHAAQHEPSAWPTPPSARPATRRGYGPSRPRQTTPHRHADRAEDQARRR